jgi:hypothetical protein
MYRCAIVSHGELEQLRSVDDVVRMGHVVALEPGRIVPDDGTIDTDPSALHVDDATKNDYCWPVPPHQAAGLDHHDDRVQPQPAAVVRRSVVDVVAQQRPTKRRQPHGGQNDTARDVLVQIAPRLRAATDRLEALLRV